MVTIKIESLADIAALSTEQFQQFQRFLPDFVAWFLSTKQPVEGLKIRASMDWFDDGHSGQIKEVDIFVGEKLIGTFANPDFLESAAGDD